MFYTQVTRNTLPADEAASAAILDAYRTNLNGLNGTFAYVDFYGKLAGTSLYLVRKYIDAYLAERVGNPADYDSAVVRLMGPTYKPLSSDKSQFAKDLIDVVASDKLNIEALYEIAPILRRLGMMYFR